MLNHDYIGTEHLLLGLVREHDGVAGKALASLGISHRGRPRGRSRRSSARARRHRRVTSRSRRAPRRSSSSSLREALQLGHNYIGTEHILLGLIREGEGVAAQVLQRLGANLNRVRETVIQLCRVGRRRRSRAAARRSARTSNGRRAPVEVVGDDAPTCPNCFGSLDETLAVKVLETTADDEPFSVKIAYCRRCGVALGAVT